jgi:hypothetical protein
MPRGHDKTSFIARMMNWVLCYSKRKHLRCIIAAKDSEQAGLLKDCMQTEATLNPWFGEKLTFFQKTVWGPSGKLTIATADALGLFGHAIDLFVMEEITHWEDVMGQKVWNALWSGREKRQSSVLVIISNAGYIDTWQHKIFVEAKNQPRRWYIYEAPGPIASWMDREAIEDDMKMLPPGEARRLIGNQWVDPAEVGAYLTKPEVQACVDESIRRGIERTPKLDPSQQYILSVDYGPKKDRTVIVLGHEISTGEVLLDRGWVFEGKDYPNKEVPIQVIRDTIEATRRESGWLWLVADPYQLKELIQYYRLHIPVEEFEARGGKSNYEMAECLRTQVVNKRILWPPGLLDTQVGSGAGLTTEGLLDELPRLVLKPMAYGYRFDHTSGRHDDRACAIGMLLVAAFNRKKPEIWVQRKKDTIQKKTPILYGDRGSKRRVLFGTRV